MSQPYQNSHLRRLSSSQNPRQPSENHVEETETVPGRRSRYVSCACIECRRRKTKCSGDHPCRRCQYHQLECDYPRPSESRGQKPNSDWSRQQQAHQKKISSQPAPTWPSEVREAPDMQRRLLQLEEEINQLKARGTSGISSQNIASIQAANLASTNQTMMADDKEYQSDSDIRPDPSSYSQDYAAERASIDDECQGQSLTYGSVAMQIRELKDSVLERDLTRKSRACPVDLETCLIPTMRMFQLLNIYFDEFNFHLPVVHRTEFMTRLRTLFATHHTKRTPRLKIKDAKPEEITFLALTCIILAKAEHLSMESVANSVPRRHHQGWYLESRRIMTRYYRKRPSNLDLVQFHLVESFYMIAVERVDRFSVSVIDAVNEALTAGLNNQKSWGECSSDSSSSRRALWWVLYLMDRQAAQRYGRSYLIHDTDFAVDDFSEECRQILSTDRSTPIPFLNCETSSRQPDRNNTKSKPQPAYINQCEWFSYLQFLVTIGRVTTRACDAFYCFRAPKAGDYEETNLIDALLLRANRTICPSLIWEGKGSTTDESLAAPASYQVMGLRLIVYLRINNLRLSIRRHLWKDKKLDPADTSPGHLSEFMFEVHVCRQIASAIIQVLVEYNSPGPSLPVIGPFSVISIIECIYNLVALPKASSITNDNHCEFITENVRKGVQCLQKLADSRDTVAQTACAALRGFLQPGICALHRSHERGTDCTISTPDQAMACSHDTDFDEIGNMFPLTDDSFRFAEPGSYVGLDIENVLDCIDTDMLTDWPPGVLM